MTSQSSLVRRVALATALLSPVLAFQAQAALTPTYYYSAGTAGGTPAEGGGSWANVTTGSSYAAWRTSSTSTAALSPGFGTGSQTYVLNYGGLTSGTATTTTVGNSSGAAQPFVGAILLQQPHAGGYTFVSSNVNKGGTATTYITLYGKSDGTNTDGILMSNNTPSTTFAPSVALYITNSLWFNNLSSAGALIINGPVANISTTAGAGVLTTAGLVQLNSANTFAGLTVNSGTTTLGASGAVTSTNGPTIQSGATLVVSNAAVTTAVTNNSGGTLQVGFSTATTNSTLTTATALGAGNVTITGSSANPSTLTSTYGSSQTIGNLTLGGYGTLSIAQPFTTGVFTDSNGNNVINYTTSINLPGTYNIVSASSLSGTLGGNLSMVVPASGGSYGSTATLTFNGPAVNLSARTTAAFQNTANNLQLVIGGGAYNLFWTGAQNSTWDYSSTNWVTNNAGVAGTTNIATAQGDNLTITNGASITVQSGGSGAGGLTVNSAADVSFSGADTVTVAGGLTNSGAANLTIPTPLTVTANGVTLSGGGKTTLSGVSTIAGGVAVSGGSTLALNNTADSITGGISVTGNGAITTASPNTLSGLAGGSVITLNNGTLNLGANNDTLSSGVALAGNGTITGSSTLTLVSGSTVTNTAGANVIAENLAGSAPIKNGGGTLTLSGNNSGYSGEIYNGGTLTASGSGNAFGTGVLSNSAGTVLDLNGQTVGNTITNVGFTMTNSSTTTAVLTNSASPGLQNGAIWYMGLAPGHSIQIDANVSGNHTLNFSGGGTLILDSGNWVSSSSATITASGDSTVIDRLPAGNFGAFAGFRMNDSHLVMAGVDTPTVNLFIGSGTTTTDNIQATVGATTNVSNLTNGIVYINTTNTYVTSGGVTNNYSRGILGAATGAVLNVGDQVSDIGAGTNNTRGTLEIDGSGSVALYANNNAYSTAQVDSGASLTVATGANLGATNAISIAGSLVTAGSFTLPAASTITVSTTNGTAGSDFGRVTVNSGTLTYAGDLTLNVPAGSVAYSDTIFNFAAATESGDLHSASISVAGEGSPIALSETGGAWSGTDISTGTTYTFTDATGVLAAVPEPASWALTGIGITVLGCSVLRSRFSKKS